MLRYQPGQGYIEHHDYLTAPQGVEPAAVDTTKRRREPARDRVFLYLSDVTAGGQTFFPHANVTFALARRRRRRRGERRRRAARPACATTASRPRRRSPRAAAAEALPDGWERRLARERARGGRNRERAFERERLERERDAPGGAAAAGLRKGGLAVEPSKEGALLYYHQRPLHGYSLDPTVKHGLPPRCSRASSGPPTSGSGTRRRRSARRGSATTRPTTRRARRRSRTHDVAPDERLALYYEPAGGGTPARMGELRVKVPVTLAAYRGHVFASAARARRGARDRRQPRRGARAREGREPDRGGDSARLRPARPRPVPPWRPASARSDERPPGG